ncbi:hypothetical protein V5E97_33690 [Singulisphaera sp. Ch08]|uniref:Uncharacterized protein n=1 Tax=Singulisphaera sp. Ch08 TaxID=3120278 RepID=A0AAU7CDV3_9BACT
MTPYYEGTSEAENLYRCTPELAEAWLKKAKQDRSRLTTRLFQPQKKEFLDGFIRGLEQHLGQAVSCNPTGAAQPEVATFAPAKISDAPPIMAEIRPETVESREPLETIAPENATILASDCPSIQTEPISELKIEDELDLAPVPDTPAAEEQERIAPTVEAGPVRLHDESAAKMATITGHCETRYEPDSETEMAMGVLRLSGWAVDEEPDLNGLSERVDTAANQLDDPPVQTGGPVPSIEWNRVFEQARGVGMVDLSAYDFIDGLGELRELIDRWQYLHQDSSSVENP